MPSPVPVFVVLVMVAVSGSAQGAVPLPFASCALIETLPGKGDPAANAKGYRGLFKKLAKQSPSRKNMARLHARFAKRTRALLSEARRTFHPDSKKPKKQKIRQFLKRYVLTPYPSLVVADEAFVPTAAIRSALAYTACRAGHIDAAIAFARTAPPGPEALTAYGAVLLVQKNRNKEAMALLPFVGVRGFLAPWVKAQLATKKADAHAFHRIAAARVQLPAQREALRWQKGQLAKRKD